MQDFNLKTWLTKYASGEFDSPDVDTQIKAGWYDWFCRDTSLPKKTQALAPKVMKVSNSKKVQALGLDKVYVFFKNNCPCVGKLYDDFRICDIETGDVIFCIVPRTGHTIDNGRAELWGSENEFKGPLTTGKFKDVMNYLNS